MQRSVPCDGNNVYILMKNITFIYWNNQHISQSIIIIFLKR